MEQINLLKRSTSNTPTQILFLCMLTTLRTPGRRHHKDQRGRPLRHRPRGRRLQARPPRGTCRRRQAPEEGCKVRLRWQEATRQEQHSRVYKRWPRVLVEKDEGQDRWCSEGQARQGEESEQALEGRCCTTRSMHTALWRSLRDKSTGRSNSTVGGRSGIFEDTNLYGLV